MLIADVFLCAELYRHANAEQNHPKCQWINGRLQQQVEDTIRRGHLKNNKPPYTFKFQVYGGKASPAQRTKYPCGKL
jgi:hypothetical protein